MNIFKFYSSEISSDIGNMGKVVEDILNYLKDLSCIHEECFIFDSKVILNELILNAIKHGNKEDRNKTVKITAALIKNRYLLLQVEDEGDGYNYNPDSNKDLRCWDDGFLPENGRGMTIVRCLCDRLKFNKNGNKIAVLKRIV